MLITFSGLDGAGKSTLITALKTLLEGRNRPVTILHMTRQVGFYAYARTVRDHLSAGRAAVNGRPPQGTAGSPNVEQPRTPGAAPGRPKPVLSHLLRSAGVHSCIYLLDLVVFFFYRLYVEKVKRQVLVMDRYFYDMLAYEMADGCGGPLLRLLVRLTPTPSLPVFVDVNPEVAYARKGEHSVAFLRGRRAFYEKIFSWVRHPVVLANEDLDESLSALNRVLQERAGAR